MLRREGVGRPKRRDIGAGVGVCGGGFARRGRLGGGVAGGLGPLVASVSFSFDIWEGGFARFVALAGGLEGGGLDGAVGWAEEALLVRRLEDMLVRFRMGRECKLGSALRGFM